MGGNRKSNPENSTTPTNHVASSGWLPTRNSLNSVDTQLFFRNKDKLKTFSDTQSEVLNEHISGLLTPDPICPLIFDAHTQDFLVNDKSTINKNLGPFNSLEPLNSLLSPIDLEKVFMGCSILTGPSLKMLISRPRSTRGNLKTMNHKSISFLFFPKSKTKKP